MLHAICALGLSQRACGVLTQQQQQQTAVPAASALVVSVTAKPQDAAARTATTITTTTTATSFTSLRELRDSGAGGDSHTRGSRDSGLNDVGSEWSYRTSPSQAGSPRTSFSGDHVQQATPERLARVQQQVRAHMETESHYQQPRPQPVPVTVGAGAAQDSSGGGKLSVRDLLGQFEARRRAGSGGSGGAPPSGPQQQQQRHEPARSYGFGSSTKTALRKVVSEASAGRSHNNQSYPNGGGAELRTSAANSAPVNARTNGNSNVNGNSNAVNNKVASSTSSRRSFLDSIIAGAASADGSGKRTSRRASMEEVNNLLNQDNRTVDHLLSQDSRTSSHLLNQESRTSSHLLNQDSRTSSHLLNQDNRTAGHLPNQDDRPQRNGHPALRKAASTTGDSRRDAVDAPRYGVVVGGAPERTPPLTAPPPPSTAPPPPPPPEAAVPSPATTTTSASSAAPSENGSALDIPSIVDQLPDDDRPQESRRTTSGWDPAPLVAALYAVPEPLRDKPRPVDRVNVEGFLERLPSGRTKATFWNAWKRCYFRAKDGLLYCYAGKHSEKPMDVTHLMGGVVEPFESMVITAQDRNPATVPVIGVDDRMGHYLVVRAATAQETDRWVRALQTHTVEDFCSTYVQPWPVPRAPALLRDSIVVDLGSRSVRAGILCSQPSLPQVFFPAVCASRRSLAASLRGLGAGLGAKADKGDKVYGPAALQPSVRASSNLSYPIRPAERISKHTVDLGAVSGFLRVVFQCLSVDPRDYGVVLSVPRTLDAATQHRLVTELFDRFGVRSVLLSHQTVLALYAYNAASGVVVDVGERTDVVPIMDGYIVEGGVSRVPYGGEEMGGHVRRFLLQRAPPVSLGTVAEQLLPRYALERLCYVSPSYRADLKRAQRDPTELAASVSVSEFFSGDKEPTMESLTLDAGRFQAPEGLFHPQAWGLDHPGVHRMVYKAIQECSMDARKTMARSVFLAGGLTMLPGFAERLREELAALLPPAVQPKVHASPYRYHAAYLGACVLANSSGVQEMSLTRDEFNRDGGKLLRPWIL